ncbi:MAG: hypothetical protein EA383_03860 [Spirochaetaceae bacterium]|nr:MAG: hypothetical protein EA383_03860 [Spirochaetaceae bacterium]
MIYSRPDTLGPCTRQSPIQNRRQFVTDDTWVRYDVEIGDSVEADDAADTDSRRLFEKAGPRETVFFILRRFVRLSSPVVVSPRGSIT